MKSTILHLNLYFNLQFQFDVIFLQILKQSKTGSQAYNTNHCIGIKFKVDNKGKFIFNFFSELSRLLNDKIS